MANSFDTCIHQLYGDDGKGTACNSDKDCYTYCDTLAARCFTPYLHPEIPLAKCLLRTSPQYTLRYLEALINILANATAETLGQGLLASTLVRKRPV